MPSPLPFQLPKTTVSPRVQRASSSSPSLVDTRSFQDDLQRSLSTNEVSETTPEALASIRRREEERLGRPADNSEELTFEEKEDLSISPQATKIHSSSSNDIEKKTNDEVIEGKETENAELEPPPENDASILLLQLQKKMSHKIERGLAQTTKKSEDNGGIFNDDNATLKTKTLAEFFKNKVDFSTETTEKESGALAAEDSFDKPLHKSFSQGEALLPTAKPIPGEKASTSMSTDSKKTLGKGESVQGESALSMAGNISRLEGTSANATLSPVVKTGMPQALLEQVVNDSHLRLAVQKSSALISLPMADGSEVALKLSIKAGVVDVKMAGDASDVFLQKSGELRAVLLSEGLDLRSLTKISDVVDVQDTDANDTLDGDDDGGNAYPQEDSADRQPVDEFAISDDGTLLANTTHDKDVESERDASRTGLHDEENLPANVNLLTSSPGKKRVHVRA